MGDGRQDDGTIFVGRSHKPEVLTLALANRHGLVTGATGFLGRYLALEWLERMSLVGGKVIALVRARNDEDNAR